MSSTNKQIWGDIKGKNIRTGETVRLHEWSQLYIIQFSQDVPAPFPEKGLHEGKSIISRNMGENPENTGGSCKMADSADDFSGAAHDPPARLPPQLSCPGNP